LVLLGSFGRWRALTVVAATGVILSAAYMLWMVQRVFFGPIAHEENQNLTDLNAREWLYLLPIVALVFWIGVYPQAFLRKIEPSIDQWLTAFHAAAKPAAANALPAAGATVAAPGPVFVVK
jgi:NADH-quinone oxidoreductase subunit M